MILFTIPKATPSNNQIKGMHYQEYKKLREEFYWLIFEDNDTHHSLPIEKCDIIITRYGSRLLDWDNAYGGIKPLMDCLVMSAKTSPNGLGIIVDDNPKVVLSLSMQQVKVPRKCEKTTIEILER